MKRYLPIILLIFFLFPRNTLNAQNINYILVDQTIDATQKQPDPESSIIDSLGIFEKPVRFLVEGVGIESKNKKFRFGNVGFWSTVPVYNFVDGFWIGQTFKGYYHFDKRNRLTVEPMVYYTSARKKVIWQNDITYEYAPDMKGKMVLSMGDVSADYDTEEHLARLENSLYSLVLGRNYMKLYQKRYVELKNNFYPLPGFRVFSGFSFQKRRSEVNHTTFSFIKDHDDQENIPLNAKFRSMEPNTALVGDVGFDYTICENCEYNLTSNEIIYSHIPTLSFRYVFGIPVGNKNRSSFNRVDAALHQRFKFKKTTTLHYKIGMGAFLTKHNLWFPDFKHFGAYSLPSMRTFTEDGYFLIGYYKADTDRKWLKGSLNFMSEKFLLTRLKFLSNGDFSEGMHARYLWTSEISHYTEWGYSVGYKDLVRVGFFIGFERERYKNFGLSVSFPWLTGGY